MSDSIKNRISTNLQKVKETGGVRAGRIRAILQDAATQTLTEVKQGAGEIGTLARSSLSTVVNDGTPETEGTAEGAEPTPVSLRTRLLAAFQVLQTRLFGQLNREYGDLHTQYTNLKQRAIQLDARLAERYGDRYTAIRQRLDGAVVWYNAQTARYETLDVTALEQKQAEFATRTGEMGVTVAQKEQQFRQQLKTFLQAAVAKL